MVSPIQLELVRKVEQQVSPCAVEALEEHERREVVELMAQAITIVAQGPEEDDDERRQ